MSAFIQFKNIAKSLLFFYIVIFCNSNVKAQSSGSSKFNVVAFYKTQDEPAHLNFVYEAHSWFYKLARQHNFTYDSTSKWQNLNSKFLSKYQVVIFLDTRPEDSLQRIAFQNYMTAGGSWMGFHFAAFALTPSDYPQNWDWYHNDFLGAGQYKSNTWKPTSAILRVEDNTHAVTKNLPTTFKSAPNEWYRWEKDLRENADIKILASIDTSSFPLGTGPKLHEIWHEGYYPVVWTNKKYKMIYMNMGHNDIDYQNGSNKNLSSTFESELQNKLITNALLWLGNSKK